MSVRLIVARGRGQLVRRLARRLARRAASDERRAASNSPCRHGQSRDRGHRLVVGHRTCSFWRHERASVGGSSADIDKDSSTSAVVAGLPSVGATTRVCLENLLVVIHHDELVENPVQDVHANVHYRKWTSSLEAPANGVRT